MKIEIERKAIINKNTFEFLQVSLCAKYKCAFIEQENVYYDTPALSLYQRNETLRIRIKNERRKLEYKFNKLWQDNGCRICNERSISVKNTPMQIAQSDALVLGVVDAPLEKLGSLMTRRMDFHINEVTISLDYNCYQGREDFEIEIESPTTILQWERYFNSRFVDFSKPVEGKYSRFIRHFNPR